MIIKINLIIFFLLIQSLSIFPQENYFLSTTPHGRKWEMYGSAVCGNYLYIVGGYTLDSGWIKLVKKARINPDGSLGSWEDTVSLPHNRSYIDNSTIVLNDIIYIVGGYDGVSEKKLNTIVWARPGANGNLGNWIESSAFPGEAVNCAVAFATPGHIYLTGGRTDARQITNKVWCATIKEDGAVSAWEKGPTLPQTLWYHSGGVAGGRAWIWGGLKTSDNASVNSKVYCAPILGSGKIGDWTASSVSLPSGFFSSPSTVSGSYLISFCPRYSGAVISGDVWYAQVSPQGITNWARSPLNIPAKLYIGLATDYRRGTVYIPGGRVSKEQIFDSKVYYLKLYSSPKSKSPSLKVPDFFITAEDPGSTDQNLSFISQTPETKSTFPGFLPYAQARNIATAQGKPMVLYTYSLSAFSVIQQNGILKNFNPAKWGDKVVFGEFNISLFPQNAQQLGIFKVPCWTFFDRNARIKRQESLILKPLEIEAYVEEILSN